MKQAIFVCLLISVALTICHAEAPKEYKGWMVTGEMQVKPIKNIRMQILGEFEGKLPDFTRHQAPKVQRGMVKDTLVKGALAQSWDLSWKSLFFKSQAVAQPASEISDVAYATLDEEGNLNTQGNPLHPTIEHAFTESKDGKSRLFKAHLQLKAKFESQEQVNQANMKFGSSMDMWVFFDDKLVVDLGGIHAFATKHLFLNSSVIKQDAKFVSTPHKIDIFFLSKVSSTASILLMSNFPVTSFTEQSTQDAPVSFSLSPESCMQTSFKPLDSSFFSIPIRSLDDTPMNALVELLDSQGKSVSSSSSPITTALRFVKQGPFSLQKQGEEHTLRVCFKPEKVSDKKASVASRASFTVGYTTCPDTTNVTSFPIVSTVMYTGGGTFTITECLLSYNDTAGVCEYCSATATAVSSSGTAAPITVDCTTNPQICTYTHTFSANEQVTMTIQYDCGSILNTATSQLLSSTDGVTEQVGTKTKCKALTNCQVEYVPSPSCTVCADPHIVAFDGSQFELGCKEGDSFTFFESPQLDVTGTLREFRFFGSNSTVLGEVGIVVNKKVAIQWTETSAFPQFVSSTTPYKGESLLLEDNVFVTTKTIEGALHLFVFTDDFAWIVRRTPCRNNIHRFDMRGRSRKPESFQTLKRETKMSGMLSSSPSSRKRDDVSEYAHKFQVSSLFANLKNDKKEEPKISLVQPSSLESLITTEMERAVEFRRTVQGDFAF